MADILGYVHLPKLLVSLEHVRLTLVELDLTRLDVPDVDALVLVKSDTAALLDDLDLGVRDVPAGALNHPAVTRSPDDLLLVDDGLDLLLCAEEQGLALLKDEDLLDAVVFK